MTKFCKDCRHCLPETADFPTAPPFKYARCALTGQPNLVTGNMETHFCAVARQDGQPCGPLGSRFEARP